MAGSTQQLTVEELEGRFRAAKNVVERSHCQAIWLLAKGHSTAEVAQIVALTPRWINKLARRRNPGANRRFETLDELDAVLAERCRALARDRNHIAADTTFHWWPKPNAAN